MATKEKKARDDDSSAAPTFKESEKALARKWFAQGADTRERRAYDYAIECYITGLEAWPDAVEEGHMPLRSVAVQRQQTGGKKPGLMETMKMSLGGKDPKRAMLTAEQLLAKDPQNRTYADGVLRSASKAGYLETCKWVAPIVLEALKRDKKPNKAHFASYREALVSAAEKAAQWENNSLETWLLEQAVNSLDYLAVRLPQDDTIRDELRDLAGRLTIARGKYDQDGDFRDSLQDADSQKLLHDSERARQGEQTLEALIVAARKAWQETPDVPAKIYALVDALLKAERKDTEDEAVDILMRAHEASRNYSFKMRADDIRLRRLNRQVSQLVIRARETGSAEDKQQARLAAMEQRQCVLEVYRERVDKYPTELRHKYKLGTALFETGAYDEAIPVLQLAQQDPRTRVRCQLLLGRCFFEQGSPRQAVEVLREALDRYEMVDEHSKELLYWLGRAYEAAEQAEEAKDAYGKLLRQDYNYQNGDARKRLEGLK